MGTPVGLARGTSSSGCFQKAAFQLTFRSPTYGPCHFRIPGQWAGVTFQNGGPGRQENLRKILKAKLIEERIHSNEHVAVHGVVYHGLSVCPFTGFDDYHVLRPPRINAAIELAR